MNVGKKTSLQLVGRTVSRCYVDFAFGLLFLDPGGKGDLQIGGRFLVKYRESEWQLSAEENLEEVGKAVVLFNKTVAGAVALEDGTLEMSFTDGTTLSVPPDPDYEAWTYAGPDHFLVVSLPGGGLAVWDSDPDSA